MFTEILSSVTEAGNNLLHRQSLRFYSYDTRTPHRSEANEVVVRAVRRVKRRNGYHTRVKKGLPEEWWDFAMDGYCYWRNLHEKMVDSKTAFEKICSQTCDGPSIPFGTLDQYIPSAAKDKSRVHQLGKKTLMSKIHEFGRKTLKRIFLGCVRRAERGWSGDLMTAGCDD